MSTDKVPKVPSFILDSIIGYADIVFFYLLELVIISVWASFELFSLFRLLCCVYLDAFIIK